MKILPTITCSNDIKHLNKDELNILKDEIRELIIHTVSKNGGHLASNLGSVELTLALHRVYDSARDRIVFDVGHQSYTHKIITGRRDRFDTLRLHDGLSGFPRPYESPDDAFIGGHASNSVSAALGMARARTLSNADYDVVAIIGDGALTGGLAMEGLANAAASGEPLVIILNDNNMSISSNVGGLSSALNSLRTKKGYINFKEHYHQAVADMPILYKANHHIKEYLKKKLLNADMFSEMGFYYLGPVDGHDIDSLETAIRYARDQRIPTLLHVLTRKGKGYPYAESNPELYHGVSPFNPITGIRPSGNSSFSSVFGETLTEIALRKNNVVAITAAMTSGTGLNTFAQKIPDRFFDVGIAEGHAVTMAAGMAKQGLIPVFAVYSSFLQRGYDMLIHDVSLAGLHVVLAVDRSGLVGNDGETHHGVFDVGYLSSVPGMKIYSPASFAELREMLVNAVERDNGPVAIKYPRGGEGHYKDCHCEEEAVLREGTDLTIVTYGILINEVLEAAEHLAQANIHAQVIKLGILKRNTFQKTLSSIHKTGKLLVAEDTAASGCIGAVITSKAASAGIGLQSAALLNLHDGIVHHGTVQELYKDCGIDAASIYQRAIEVVNFEKNKT